MGSTYPLLKNRALETLLTEYWRLDTFAGYSKDGKLFVVACDGEAFAVSTEGLHAWEEFDSYVLKSIIRYEAELNRLIEEEKVQLRKHARALAIGDTPELSDDQLRKYLRDEAFPILEGRRLALVAGIRLFVEARRTVEGIQLLDPRPFADGLKHGWWQSFAT